MRYHKGLRIGHIYTRLRSDDTLFVDASLNGTQHLPALADDGSYPMPSLPGANDWIVQDKNLDLEVSGLNEENLDAENVNEEDSEEENIDDECFDEGNSTDNLDYGGSDRDSDGERDSQDDGSGDSLDLEYQEMYGDRCDSDFDD
jgi:hypothetical protein